jgi:hypothetical protein
LFCGCCSRGGISSNCQQMASGGRIGMMSVWNALCRECYRVFKGRTLLAGLVDGVFFRRPTTGEKWRRHYLRKCTSSQRGMLAFWLLYFLPLASSWQVAAGTKRCGCERSAGCDAVSWICSHVLAVHSDFVRSVACLPNIGQWELR